MSAALREAIANVGARRGRALLNAAGIALVAAMLAVAATVSYGLLTGFDRSARQADLPDVIVSFDGHSAGAVSERIKSLPDVESFSLRNELTDVPFHTGDHSASNGVVEVVGPGRRGYAIVAGHDVTRRGGLVLEQGLADSWGVGVGDRIRLDGSPPLPVVGLARAPDNVAYPLAAPHAYISLAALRRADPRDTSTVNVAQIWLQDPAGLDTVLVQARLASFGLNGLSLVTREGVHILIDQAAGIVIALLAALSLIALLTAAAMLTASASAEIQRRLRSIGVWRAIGASRGHVATVAALEAFIIALPAAALGVALGGVLAVGPSDRLLGLLNQSGPGAALLLPLVGCFLVAVAIPTLAGVVPAWRAAGGSPLRLLRGAELGGGGGRRSLRRLGRRDDSEAGDRLGREAARAPRGRGAARASHGRQTSGDVPDPSDPLGPDRDRDVPGAAGARRADRGGASRSAAGRGGGLLGLGARLATARRVRLTATVATLAICTSFILLMLALASELDTLANDPTALGRRYQLTASLPASAAPKVRALPGVSAAAPRYEVSAVDSFALGEITYAIAFRGDHTRFEAPPLVEGRRLRGNHEAEVGRGLAQVLGLDVGSTLALTLASGNELRLRVSGIVNSVEHDGRVAYVPLGALLRAEPSAPEKLAVVVSSGASTDDVSAALERLGSTVTATKGVVGSGKTLVDALRVLLLTIAIVDGLVCLYTLGQALALTATERGRAIAVLRACGAGPRSIRALLAGTAVAVLLPAAALAVLLEVVVLGPVLSGLAADYATLPLAASAAEILILLAGLAAIGALAVWWVGRRIGRGSIVRGLG